MKGLISLISEIWVLEVRPFLIATVAALSEGA